MIEEKVPEGVALRVEARLTAQTGGLEPGELHQGPERRLTPRYRHCRTRHCRREGGPSGGEGEAKEECLSDLKGTRLVF